MMKLMKTNTNSRVGHDFESRVRRAFEGNGYLTIDQNQWRKNYNRGVDPASKREYDLVMLNAKDRQFRIIECKAHMSKTALVGLDLVKEFYQKLSNYNGLAAKRLMVTDTGYTPQAIRLAKSGAIYLMDGVEFVRFERQASVISYAGSRIGGSLVRNSLESIMDSIAGRIKLF
jgi:hypothetical protein